MEDIIISLDIGTTVVKSVIFNTKAEEVNLIEMPFFTCSPTRGAVEQDPEVLWKTIVEILSAAVKVKKKDQNIQAITIATQGGSLVPVDREGNPVYNIITWMDSRAANLVEKWIKNGIAERIRSISGWTLQPGLPLPVIAWLQKNNPDVFNQAFYWLSINDYISHKLTGIFATNPSMAGEMLLTDIQSGQWNSELCHFAGLKPEQLSPILPSGTVIAGINNSCSMATGLTQGTPVVNAGQDHACEALALGLIEEDSAFLACGTAWVINGITNSCLVEDIPQKMDLNFHVLPNRWITSQFLGCLGAYPEWCLNQFWALRKKNQPAGNRYQYLDEEFNHKEKIDEDLFFLPFNGSQNLPGKINSGGFFGLQFSHTLPDLSFAVLESAGFEVRWALQELVIGNNQIPDLWMVGGASRSPVWPQILADINGTAILISSFSHGPALGAAILAWSALGILDNFKDCSKFINLNTRRFRPDSHKKIIYDRKFSSYQSLIKNYNHLTTFT